MKTTDRAGVILEEIAKRFSEEKFPEMCAKAFISVAEIPSSKWSLGNRVAMLMENTEDARGYRQWESVGRYVKKGSKAIYILVPLTIKRKDGKKGKDEKDGKMITIGFRGMPVFKYEDTDGKPLEEYKPKELPPLFGLAEKNGQTVEWKNSTSGEHASINIKSGDITLSTEAPDSFLHEMVHWYDNKNVKLKVVQDAEQETVAQLGACVLAKMYGYDVEAYTWNYIARYAKTNSPQKVGQLCFKMLGRVQKAIEAILADAESLKEPVATSSEEIATKL